MIRFLPLVALLWAAAPSAQINTGAALPQAGTAALSDAAGRAGLVVVFWSPTCPWANRYEPRLAGLVDGYAPAGFGFVLIGSNRTPSDAPLAGGLDLPVVQDPSGAIARAFGVSRAPHIFLFGPDLTLLYDGAIDDSPASADRVRTPYLAQAMDQSVAGLAVDIQRTQSFGCTLARSSASPTPE